MLLFNHSLNLVCRFASHHLGNGHMLLGAVKPRDFKPFGFVSLAMLLMAGCSGPGESIGGANNAMAPPNRILDPVAAFAAEPPGNGQAQVFLADRNETVTLRFVRQYAAASGRECREVRVTQRGGDNQRLYCRAGAGWIEARPLISASAVQ
jgi:hypothetical protein